MRSFSDVFGDTMVTLAQKNEKLCAITAAMPGGTGLLQYMKQFPQRLFDVGIAEEHAVSMAGGLAKQGMVPVVAIYSTFLQRAYDQLMQDVAMLRLHVVLAVDRAGLVGDDGPTHHGVFDVGFLRQVPGMQILAPASLRELEQMLTWAVETCDGPVAVRYPRGTEGAYTVSAWDGTARVVSCGCGADVTLITYGTMINAVLAAAEELKQQGISCTVLRLLELSALPAEEILRLMPERKTAVVIEETASGSGVMQALAWQMQKLCSQCRVSGIDLGRDFVPHGSQQRLYEYCGLDAASIAQFVSGVLTDEK